MFSSAEHPRQMGSPLDAQVFFSHNILGKFRTKLDTATATSLQDAGLAEMIKDGTAMTIKELSDPYDIIIFPKTSPSRPYEIMFTAVPRHEGLPARSSLSDFNEQDAQEIVKTAQHIADVLREVAQEHSHTLTDGYIFQHFNPYDLNPKTPYNGSIAHLHLHIQMHGHSLDQFPRTYLPAGTLRDYEGAAGLLRDPGVTIFLEMIQMMYPELGVELANAGCVRFNEKPAESEVDGSEMDNLLDILRDWDEIWKNFAQCFVVVDELQSSHQVTLLPREERIRRISNLLQTYQLSRHNQQILLFLANHLQSQSINVWRNFYHGQNGSLGMHIDYEKHRREWLIAPRLMRSWSRHLPIISTADSPLTEWTMKNESGDGLVNTQAANEIFVIQREVIQRLKVSQKDMYASR